MKSYYSIFLVMVLAHASFSLVSCKQRPVGSSALRDDLSNLNLEPWPAARSLRVDSTQQNVNSTYYFNEAVDGGLTKVEIGVLGSTNFSVSTNAVQTSPFVDADGDGTKDYPKLLIYKEGSGPNDLLPVFNGAGEVQPSYIYDYGVSYDLNAIDTREGETYYFAFLHHATKKFNNDYAASLNVRHTPITEINTPVHEISITGDPRGGFNHDESLRIGRQDITVVFKLDHNHSTTPVAMEFGPSVWRADGNCDNRVSTFFVFDDANGQGRVPMAQDANPCQGFDGNGGFMLTTGGKYSIEMEIKNPNGPIGTNNFSFYSYNTGSNPNAQPMSLKAFPNGGVVDVNGNNNYMNQNGKVVADLGFKGKFSGIQGRTFVDVNVYSNSFNPLNSTTTTRRPNMLVITNSANADRVEFPLGNGSNASGETILEVKDNVEYTFLVQMSHGPDVTGSISVSFRKSEAILPPRTQNVVALEGTLKDVPNDKQQENFFFPAADDYKTFLLAEAQAGRFHFLEHMPPNNTIPPNDPTGAYPNETLAASPSTGRPLMRELVFYAMKDIQLNWHKAQDIDDLDDASNAEMRYVDRGTIAACLGNTAEHWSDLILHFYCQFGQMRGCYTEFIRSKAPTLATIADPAARVAAANTLRLEGFEACIVSGDGLGNIDAKTAASQGKISEYEWRWVKDRVFKYPDPDTGPNEASMAAVFQYVMMAPTFRWHMQHEQDVLNAFYRVDRTDDLASCSASRIPRGTEDTQANFCAGNKKHASLLAPAAR